MLSEPLRKEALNGVKMQPNEIIAYYSRRDIQKAIWESAKDREVAVRVNESFAKRPDTIELPGDVADWARKGATSFHISEERWATPLDLKTGMTKKQLDELRKGWDLIIDIDTPFWEYAKLTAYYVVEALKFHDIRCIGVKMSGNKGFHIAVPFEAFPDEVNGIKTKDLFPESLRVIASYLQNMIKGHLAEAILQKEHISQIASKAGKRIDEITINNVFDPFKLVDIDTVLISSRHMFRAPYSLHEKAGLVSLPIKPDEILTFEKEKAKPFAVKPLLKFIDREAAKQNEAATLIIQAFDWDKKAKREGRAEDKLNAAVERKKSAGFEDEKIVVKEEYFPPCMKKIIESKLDDGKKRALFLLLKFLIHSGWSWEDIEKKLYEWNSNHPEPLRENYLLEQISWHKKQKIIVLPPNCDKAEYYQELQFCSPLPLCSKIRNPVNFAKINAKRRASIEANQMREKEKDERRAKRTRRAPRIPKKS